jgi:hypothetical protein
MANTKSAVLSFAPERELVYKEAALSSSESEGDLKMRKICVLSMVALMGVATPVLTAEGAPLQESSTQGAGDQGFQGQGFGDQGFQGQGSGTQGYQGTGSQGSPGQGGGNQDAQNQQQGNEPVCQDNGLFGCMSPTLLLLGGGLLAGAGAAVALGSGGGHNQVSP